MPLAGDGRGVGLLDRVRRAARLVRVIARVRVRVRVTLRVRMRVRVRVRVKLGWGEVRVRAGDRDKA